MAKNIRSKYIKNLISESKGISEGLEETTKEALKDILRETVNEQFRSILAEADDDFDEEEVDTEAENAAVAQEPEVEAEDGVVADEEPVDTAAEAEGEEVPEEEPDEEEEEIWNSLEQYKNEDGEYDLTGMDGKEAARVLKVMDPDKDGIRIVKDGNKIELTDDDAGTEYVIELEPEENEFEIEVDESVTECDDNLIGESENTGNTGYMGNKYQGKTAMTTPDNHEPSPMDGYRDWDKGAPHGTEKRYGKSKGDPQPFNEGIMLEVELDDEMEEHSGPEGPGRRHAVKTHHNTNKTTHTGREGSEGGRLVNPSTESDYQPDKEEDRADEAIKRKANKVFRENKELKAVAGKIKDKLEESYLLNYNLGRVVKIITENSTTREEKIDIVNRFSESKSIEESNRLYETISKELNSSKKTADIEKSLNGPITEARSIDYKPSVVETSMYRSEDLHETLDLMERMDRLNRK